MILRTITACFIAGTALAGSVLAASQNETFRDWKASLDEVNTGEDVRRTCTASTTAKDAADKDWTLKVAISNGDALPPDAYPAIVVAVAGGRLPNGDNQPAVFGFGDKPIDAKVSGGGKEVMVNNVKETSLALLKAMAAGSTLDLALPAEPAATLSLTGFTAAYRKLGGWCGFPTTDVAR